jgi:hypothetical protein
MTNSRRVGVAVAGLTLALCGLHSPASATGGIFDNCTNFNEKFPHGVGKKNAVDHTSGTPVTTFVHSDKKYATAMNKNAGLDGDKDKVACEKA